MMFQLDSRDGRKTNRNERKPMKMMTSLGVRDRKSRICHEGLACVAGVRRGRGRGRELGHETTGEGGGRRGTPTRKPLFSPSRLLIKKITKNNATVND